MSKINVLNTTISYFTANNSDFVSLTDIGRYKDMNRTDYLISNWLRNRNTIEFLGIWEQINNSNFKPIEFDGIKKLSGLNSFILTPKQGILKTNAIGIISKVGRGGGTFAHKDIALEFASWISVEFKLYLLKEFQRLKFNENNLDWDLRRTLTKINYAIQTTAIKENLIPKELNKLQINKIYATEADILNMALFSKLAIEWRSENPEKEGNIRDYANVTQLVCLSNLESLNAHLISEGLTQSERLLKLNLVAISQMKVLLKNTLIKKIS